MLRVNRRRIACQGSLLGLEVLELFRLEGLGFREHLANLPEESGLRNIGLT